MLSSYCAALNDAGAKRIRTLIWLLLGGVASTLPATRQPATSEEARLSRRRGDRVFAAGFPLGHDPAPETTAAGTAHHGRQAARLVLPHVGPALVQLLVAGQQVRPPLPQPVE